jgi:prepilin-type N-terminal cleavage/methylation domain-containing protein
MKTTSNQKGFTLLEILLVVAAIAILAGIVILAINPNKQLGDTRNAQRRMDVNTILNGVYQYSLSNGSLPTSIAATSSTGYTCAELQASSTMQICKSALCSDLTDLQVLTSGEAYLTAIPSDPQTATANGSGYWIAKSSNNRVTVCAPGAEQSAEIKVTR